VKDDCNTILALLVECVNLSESAWATLQHRYVSFVISVFRSLCASHNLPSAAYARADEFCTWFFGWLSTKQCRLQNAFARLNAEIKAGRVTCAEEQELCFKNYLSKVIRSAFVEYQREIASGPQHLTVISADASADSSDDAQYSILDDMRNFTRFDTQKLFGSESVSQISFEETIATITDVVHNMDSADAVPLILKTRSLYELIGLGKKHVRWFAACCKMKSRALRALLENEYLANQGRKYPFSATFIARLLGIQPSTVDQRAHRALEKLRATLRRLIPEFAP